MSRSLRTYSAALCISALSLGFIHPTAQAVDPARASRELAVSLISLRQAVKDGATPFQKYGVATVSTVEGGAETKFTVKFTNGDKRANCVATVLPQALLPNLISQIGMLKSAEREAGPKLAALGIDLENPASWTESQFQQVKTIAADLFYQHSAANNGAIALNAALLTTAMPLGTLEPGQVKSVSSNLYTFVSQNAGYSGPVEAVVRCGEFPTDPTFRLFRNLLSASASFDLPSSAAPSTGSVPNQQGSISGLSSGSSFTGSLSS